MVSHSVKCPECDAPIGLGPAQRHCECVECGSKFVIGFEALQEPQLTHFEALVAQGLNGVPVQAAEQRLAGLDAMIAQAEADVQAKHLQLEAAREANEVRRAEVQEVIAPFQNWTYLTGIAAVGACFLVWFVLEDVAWLLALGVGIVCLVLSWGFHSKWLGAESWAKEELHRSRGAIEELEAELSDAYLRLQDRVLERELRKRVLAAVR